MKKIITILSFFMFSLAATAQTSVTKVNKNSKTAINKSAIPGSEATVSPKGLEASLFLKEKEFDFGKIPQGKPVTHVFEFVNSGKVPFVLNNVQASCGCTTPEWNRDTVATGATAMIKVGYNAANEGSFTKSVTITYGHNQFTQIFIKGEVWKTPVTSAPLNTSLNSLKNEQ